VDEIERASSLRAAVELFNRGRYLAAHELFDELWESTHGPDSDFYKGWVQAAVALHHLEQGNAEGAARLYRGHRRLLAGYLPTHLGLDVEAFLAAMQALMKPRLAAAEPGELPADARPRIRFVQDTGRDVP
jgi:hypothetical protein